MSSYFSLSRQNGFLALPYIQCNKTKAFRKSSSEYHLRNWPFYLFPTKQIHKHLNSNQTNIILFGHPQITSYFCLIINTLGQLSTHSSTYARWSCHNGSAYYFTLKVHRAIFIL